MVKVRKCVLTLAAIAAALPSAALAQKFFPDDPIHVVPPPLPVTDARKRDIDPIYDFFNSTKPHSPTPARAINTLGDVPDSAWFTNRHGQHRMTREALQRGPGTDNAPVPPFLVIGGKAGGITPGFRMRDSTGRLYFVKPDPVSNPEMATAADVVVSKFFYAIGYNTPENYIAQLRTSELHLSKKAQTETADGKSRKMTKWDLEEIIENIPRSPDGSLRVIASLKLDGEALGPFRYVDTRSDDPNDTVPHEDRRDLRGLFVFSAWLNHTDARAENTLDTLVQENNTSFIRHHLIDFGAALGSDGDRPKDARRGHEYVSFSAADTMKGIVQLGLAPAEWERAKFPDLPSVGNFESATFVPDQWKSNYKNPAFLARLPDDEFWAAKVVMSFNDDDIRAIVETGEYSDPRAVDYITATLAERRDKIGRAYFSKVLPLDRFRVQNGALQFEDLAVSYGFRPAVEYKIQWFRFDNIQRRQDPLPGRTSAQLPVEAAQAAPDTYFSAVIDPADNSSRSVTVYIRKNQAGYSVVGIERKW
jgi:hypothetical protein